MAAIDASTIKSASIETTANGISIIATLKQQEGGNKLVLGTYSDIDSVRTIFQHLCDHWSGGYYIYKMPRTVSEITEKHSFFE